VAVRMINSVRRSRKLIKKTNSKRSPAPTYVVINQRLIGLRLRARLRPAAAPASCQRGTVWPRCALVPARPPRFARLPLVRDFQLIDIYRVLTVAKMRDRPINENQVTRTACQASFTSR
jgi:hypothetical protein